MIFNHVPFLLALSALLISCNAAVELDVEHNAEQQAGAIPPPRITIDLANLCSDVSVPDAEGKMVKGERECNSKKKVCQKVGQTDCTIVNAKLYGIDPKDLVADNIKVGIKVGEIVGNYIADEQTCTAEGDSQCVATADYPAAKVADIEAKVLKGQAIGHYAGTFEPDLPPASAVLASAQTGSQQGTIVDCTDSSVAGCVVPGSHAATAVAAIVAGDIKKDEAINGVTGSFRTSSPVCTANGNTECLVEGAFKSLDSTKLMGANLEKDYVLLTTTGTVNKKPANCGTDGEKACVAHGTFAAIKKDDLKKGHIRNGVTIGGVQGGYPSAAYPLASSQVALADLQSGSFASSLADPAAFEYWDANGVRYTGAGSADLAAQHILTAKSIFGVGGALIESPSTCNGDNQDGCVATGTYPAIKKSLLSEGIIRNGITIAGIEGKYPSASYPLPGKAGNDDLNFPANLAGAHSVVFWDAEGNPQTVAAAPQLVDTNILAGKTILGVGGNATASPPDCGSHNQLGCVAKAGYPSYPAARLVAANIKKGVTLQGPHGPIEGVYPSATAPFKQAATGNKKLTDANFNASIASSDAFEFWDSTGTMHTAGGDADFIAENLLKDVTAFGVTGTYQPQPAPCSATKVIDCVASVTRPSYNSGTLTADLIKKGVKIGTLTGTYPSAAAPLATDTGKTDLTSGNFNSQVSSATQFEYWNSAGEHFTAIGDADIAVTDNIRSGVNILGNVGSQDEIPSDCNVELQDDCVAKTHFKTVDTTRIDARNIKSGVTVLGVMGSYPSAGNLLPGGTALTDLTLGGWNAALASADSVEFWNAAGEVQTASGSALLVAGNIKDGSEIFGVTGSVKTTSGPCTAAGQQGCTANNSFPSYDKNALTPAVIKNGEQILGVTGDYVSGTRPLADGGFAGDTLSDDFNGSVTSSSTFQFWDSNGARHEVSGDGNISANNLSNSVTVFGVTGSVQPFPEIDPWDVLYNESYTDSSGTQKTGKLKVNCRNMTDSDSGEHKEAGAINPYRNIDDFNNGRNRMPNQNPFNDDAYKCNGDAFVDVSYNTSTSSPGTCGQANVKCIYKDRISKLSWHQVSFGGDRKTYSQGKTKCSGLSVGGLTNWRLPTQKEALMAYVHGIRDISLRVSGNASRFPVHSFSWTSTQDSTDSDQAYAVEMVQGISRPQSKLDTELIHCVHDN